MMRMFQNETVHKKRQRDSTVDVKWNSFQNKRLRKIGRI